MAYPVLLARTPRAGRFNHVNLLPPGDLPAGFNPADFLGAAARQPVGENYLAACKIVPQVDSAREGREILVLAGVGLPADPRVRTELSAWLGMMLETVGQLVTTTDWEKHDGSSLSLRELAAWQQECVSRFGLAKYPGECSRPLTRRPKKARWAWVAGTIVLALAGLAVGYVVRSGGPTPGPSDKGNNTDKVTRGDEARAWENLGRGLGGSLGGDRAVRVAVSLGGLDGFEPPSNFAALTESQQRDWLLRCKPFRDWLVLQFGEQGAGTEPRDFTPYIGKHDPATVAALEQVTGPLNSLPAVLAGRKRMLALRDLVTDLGKIETVGLDRVQSPERFHLFYWVAESRRADRPPPPAVAPDVPFLTPRETRAWGELLLHVESLDQAIRRDVPQLARDKASLFALSACKRLRDLDRYFAEGGSRYTFYDGGGTGSGCPLPVARKAVAALRAFPSAAGEQADSAPE